MKIQPIYEFNKGSDISNWYVVDDVVMGGRSDGHFEKNEDGFGQFSGHVSLENNGGFSSVRHVFGTMHTSGAEKFQLRVKGDGKTYQFRVKSDRNDRHAYIVEFETTGDWQTIAIPFESLEPSFRGRKLDLPVFSGGAFEEIAFLIANKRNEDFKLLIDYIGLD